MTSFRNSRFWTQRLRCVQKPVIVTEESGIVRTLLVHSAPVNRVFLLGTQVLIVMTLGNERCSKRPELNHYIGATTGVRCRPVLVRNRRKEKSQIPSTTRWTFIHFYFPNNASALKPEHSSSFESDFSAHHDSVGWVDLSTQDAKTTNVFFRFIIGKAG